MTALLALALALSSVGAALSRAAGPIVGVIVREAPGSGGAAERVVRDLGGTVGRRLGIIDGFAAEIPADGLSSLRSAAGILSVTENLRVRFHHAANEYDPVGDPGSWHNVPVTIGARALWEQGFLGVGVDIALVDTGIAPVDGLDAAGKVVNGPDLSFESQSDALRYLDSYGHGTHMAGLMAGRDTDPAYTGHHRFLGVAPYARVVNLKVADAFGAADVSQVIAAIDWVVQHRNDDGLNIRVLNLSFGTDGTQDYRVDPLAYAVEVAWRRGIFVVVSAGNQGGTPGQVRLDNPAYDPNIFAVAADDPNSQYRPADDLVPEWSSRGDGIRNPDLIAPAKSVAGLRNPNSQIDLTHPEGRVGGRFFRGSGTSQAAAIVSGAAALLLQARPQLTPDQLKAILKSTARPIPDFPQRAQGAGLIDVAAALTAPAPLTTTAATWSTGTGSLELARGTGHVSDADGTQLVGEQDIFGATWDGKTWSADAWEGKTWSTGSWRGIEWAGGGWNGVSWAGKTWSGKTWSTNAWSGKTWSDASWSGKTWSGKTWSDGSWDGKTWSGKTWSGKTWSGSYGSRFWGEDFNPLIVQLDPLPNLTVDIDALAALVLRLL